jgi:hypothetical protein
MEQKMTDEDNVRQSDIKQLIEYIHGFGNRLDQLDNGIQFIERLLEAAMETEDDSKSEPYDAEWEVGETVYINDKPYRVSRVFPGHVSYEIDPL